MTLFLVFSASILLRLVAYVPSYKEVDSKEFLRAIASQDFKSSHGFSLWHPLLIPLLTVKHPSRGTASCQSHVGPLAVSELKDSELRELAVITWAQSRLRGCAHVITVRSEKVCL